MLFEQITITVPKEAAEAYLSVSPEEQRKLEALISLRLLEVTRSTESLKDMMRQISDAAQDRGLTPEILEHLLDDEL
jgi:hypothetical protein